MITATAVIIVLCLLAAVMLAYIFLFPYRPFEEDLKAFTVLVYRKDDIHFDKQLLEILSQLRWTEPCFCSEIYIVHMNVPDNCSYNVRRICASRQYLIYMSIDEFKNSLERDCNLSKKVV